MTLKTATFAIVILTILSAATISARLARPAEPPSQAVNLMLSNLPPGQDPQRFPGYVAPKYKDFVEKSLYLTMRDGVKIAITVVVPKDLSATEKIPALMRMTRYRRVELPNNGVDGLCNLFGGRFFCAQGYAMVGVDARGTGASFGVWRGPFSQDEIKDYSEVVDWIVAQPWSNGKVGTIGTSYDGNTALELAAMLNPAVKAVVPRHFEFDEYAETPYPGGVFDDWLVKNWNAANQGLDTNPGVKLVDEDTDGRLYKQATAHRAENMDVYALGLRTTFRDDRASGVSLDDRSIHTYRSQIDKSQAAINSWGGWFDASTADAVIKSFMNLTNYQRAIIGPWNHGGGQNASPYQAANPPRVMQGYECLRFFDHYLKGTDTGLDPTKDLYYFTMGEEKWKVTTIWPVAGTRLLKWYLNEGNALSPEAPGGLAGADRYTVDFDATSGTTNRWHAQLGSKVYYPDRSQADKKLLAYTTAPLEKDMEITGHPVIDLFITSTDTDGAFFVYLEDVDEHGTVTYITEGELRALHRKVSNEPSPLRTLVPYHSFLRKDAMPLVPGEPAELKFGLLPTSVLIRKGHRLRIAIAGADKDTFARIPEKGTPLITVMRNHNQPSWIELPVIER